jgi:hypothetical protein
MTSVLNVDTIADKAGTGPVGLTKQVAAKHLANYDAVNQTVDSSFNSSSVTDSSTGKFQFNFTNSFNALHDKVPQFNCWSTQDDGSSRYIASTRGMSTEENGAIAHSTSKVSGEFRYGASDNSASAVNDLNAHYVTVFGDLA